jgi:tRNA (guanine9-N1)-methyltransferase
MKKLKREEDWYKKRADYKKFLKEQDKVKKEKKKEIKETLKQKNPEEFKKIYIDQKQINPPRSHIKEEYLKNIEKGIKIIIDCKFEEFMNEKDIKSLMKQITMCYSTNKKSNKPFNLILFDVGPLLNSQILFNQCEKWLGIKIIKEGEYKDLKSFINKELLNKEKLNTFTVDLYNNDNEKDKDKDKDKEFNIDNMEKFLNKIAKINTIYLTGDSENEIKDLDNDKIYIIGGIIDRNKYKNITLNKSDELDISHARLPIGKFMNLKTSKILATNHVFEILLNYYNNSNEIYKDKDKDLNDYLDKNWEESFKRIIPDRKIDKDKVKEINKEKDE